MMPRIVKSYRRMDRGVVQRMGRLRAVKVPPQAVIAAVAERTGKEFNKLTGADRTRAITYARHLAMWALQECSLIGPSEIGRLFNRDHSSVLAGIQRIQSEMAIYPAVHADARAVLEVCRR